jgi:hypothetical protein
MESFRAPTIGRSRRSSDLVVQDKLPRFGWTRIVRATDFKLQWIRKIDQKGEVNTSQRFNVQELAFVRKLEVQLDDEHRYRMGILSLVPASEVLVESKIKRQDRRNLVTYADLLKARTKRYDEKAQWFQDKCVKLCGDSRAQGQMRMTVRRRCFWDDSLKNIMLILRKDMRKKWLIDFVEDGGLKTRGTVHEWFDLICWKIFDPNMGLWMRDTANSMNMTINPSSGT